MRSIVIIPSFNELENISRVIEKVLIVADAADEHELSILVVDDSSPDGTAERVRTIMKKEQRVQLLLNKQKAGLGAAYLKGMEHAFNELNADVVFEFDADLSHDAEKIPLFLAKIREGYDMVLGSRYRKGGSIPSDWGVHRKLLSVLGNLFITLVLTNFSIRDWTTGYRAITKKVYESVAPEMKGKRFSGYTFQIGFLHKAVQKGFSVAEVPFHFVDREHGHSKLGAEYIKNTLMYILRERFLEVSQWRVFKFAVVGFIGFSVNAVMLIFVFGRMPWVGAIATWLRGYIDYEFINIAFVGQILAAECAIISNFVFNNIYTFTERKMSSPVQILWKFPQFNLSSLGTVFIGSWIVGFGTSITGITPLSKLVWLVFATAVGMVLNFLVYSKLIWRKKKNTAKS